MALFQVLGFNTEPENIYQPIPRLYPYAGAIGGQCLVEQTLRAKFSYKPDCKESCHPLLKSLTES